LWHIFVVWGGWMCKGW